MKKFFPVFFAILLAFNSVGLLVYYWGEVNFCKVAVQEKTSRDCLRFYADDKDVQLVNDDEFLFHGKLFDIVEKKTRGGRTIYFAYSDEQEDGLMESIAQLSRMNSTENSLPGKSNFPEILKYTSSQQLSFSFFLHKDLKEENTSFAILFFDQPFRNIFSPPPNFLLS